jgi:hypothetical protein
LKYSTLCRADPNISAVINFVISPININSIQFTNIICLDQLTTRRPS